MEHAMTTPAFAGVDDARVRRRISLALETYPKRHRTAIKAVAAADTRFADLALSFPALLFVLAVPHRGVDCAQLRVMVQAGVPLKALAQAAGLPLWLRKLPPQAFEEPIGRLPIDPLVVRQLGNFLPKRARHAARWLRCVSVAADFGTDGFALWMARLAHGERMRFEDDSLKALSLWAWFAERPDTELGKLCRKSFHLRMTLKGAAHEANEWCSRANMHLNLKYVLLPNRFRAATVDGFDFVPLDTAERIADEATRMGNCIMGYGYDITELGVELWSARKDGCSVATISISPFYDDGFARISQIKAPENKKASREVALAARRWFNLHDLVDVSREVAKIERSHQLKAWQALLKPYWLAKKRSPVWPARSNDSVSFGGIYV
jgi:hypothetical protein